MGKEETLLKLKDAESQIRSMKEAAERDREAALRNARREALELLEKFREQADARYREILNDAERAVASERDKMLAAARAEAAQMSARGRESIDKAVDLVVGKFRGAIRA